MTRFCGCSSWRGATPFPPMQRRTGSPSSCQPSLGAACREPRHVRALDPRGWTNENVRAVANMAANLTAKDWPELPLEAWKDTYATLHMWTQIVGKVRL